MTPIIRFATAADTTEIAALWHIGWHEAHAALSPPALVRHRSPDRFKARTRAACPLMRIAAQGNRILGMTLLRDDEVEQFYVAAQARGTGIAAALMNDAEARIAAAGHPVAWLACAVGNERARRFYEKRGWITQRTENMRFETQQGPVLLPIWRMEKPLAPHPP